MTLLQSIRLSSAGLLACVAAPAFADLSYETASGGSVTVYGQFTPALVAVDDGGASYTQLGDNAASVSRFGVRLSQPLGESELRFRFETAFGFGTTSAFSQASTPRTLDWDREQLRHVDFELRTPRAGTFYFGQGSMATDGLGNQDKSDTTLAASVTIADVAGGYAFRDTSGALSNLNIDEAFVSFDGSRRGRIRYDTPEFAGFTFRAAYGRDVLDSGNSDRFYDAGVAYETDLENGVELEAGLGVQVRERTGARDRRDQYASVSAVFPSGVTMTFAVGERNTAGQYGYAKLGYVTELVAAGATAFSVDVYSGTDTRSDGDRARSLGLSAVQEFDDQDIEAYFGARRYAYSDTTATSYQDITSYILGARWRF